MNQYFNLMRFGRLLRKHTAEYWKMYCMSAAVLLGGILIVMGFLTYLNHNRLDVNMQAIFLLLFLLAAGCFCTSTVLGQYGAGRQAALALTLPASQLEKFLVAWLFSVPVFLIVFGIVFYAADWLILHVMSSADTPQLPLISSEHLEAIRFYLVLHGVALWGGIFFQRLQPIKIAFVGFGLALLASLANYQWLERLLGTKLHQAIPFGAVVLDMGMVNLSEAQTPWLDLVPLVLAVLLWAAAYARLTEKQL